MKVTRRSIITYLLSWLGVIFVLGQVIGYEPPRKPLSLNTNEGNDSVIVTFNGLHHKELLFASQGLYHSPVPFEREFEKITTQVALLYSNGKTISSEKLPRTRDISSFHKTATRSHVVTASEILDIASSSTSSRQAEMSTNPLLILQNGMHKTVTPSEKDKENDFPMLKKHKITPSVPTYKSVVTYKDGIKTPSSVDIKTSNLSGKQHISEQMRSTPWFNALTLPVSHAISMLAFSKGQSKTDVAKITSETNGDFSKIVSTSYVYNSISSASLTYELEHSRKPIISEPDLVQAGKSSNLSTISLESKALQPKLFSNTIVTATTVGKPKINGSATDLFLSSSSNYPHIQDLFVSKETSTDQENFLYTTEPLKILNSTTSRVTVSTIFGNLSQILNVNSAAGISTLELSVSRETLDSSAIHLKGKSPGTELFPSPSTTRKNLDVSPSIFHGQISHLPVIFNSTASPITLSREFRKTLSLLLKETVTDVKINNSNSFQNVLSSQPFCTEIKSGSNKGKNFPNRTFTADVLRPERTLTSSAAWKKRTAETVTAVEIKNYTSVQNILTSQPFITEIESASNKGKNFSDRTFTADVLSPERTLTGSAVGKNRETETVTAVLIKNYTSVQNILSSQPFITGIESASNEANNLSDSTFTVDLLKPERTLTVSAVGKNRETETITAVIVKNYTSVQNILSSQLFITGIESASNDGKNLSDRTFTAGLLRPAQTSTVSSVWKNRTTEKKVNSKTWKKSVSVIQTSFVGEQTSTDVNGNTYSKDPLPKLSTKSNRSLTSGQKFVASSAVFATTPISETSKTMHVLTNINVAPGVDPTSVLYSKATSSVVPVWLADSSLTTGHSATMATEVFASLPLSDTTTSTTNIVFPRPKAKSTTPGLRRIPTQAPLPSSAPNIFTTDETPRSTGENASVPTTVVMVSAAKETSRLPLLLSIALIPSILLVIVIVVFFIWRRRRNKNNGPVYKITVEYADEMRPSLAHQHSLIDLTIKGIHIDLEFPTTEKRKSAMVSSTPQIPFTEIQMKEFQFSKLKPKECGLKWLNEIFKRQIEMPLPESDERSSTSTRRPVSVYSVKEKENYEPSEKVTRHESLKRTRETPRYEALKCLRRAPYSQELELTNEGFDMSTKEKNIETNTKLLVPEDGSFVCSCTENKNEDQPFENTEQDSPAKHDIVNLPLPSTQTNKGQQTDNDSEQPSVIEMASRYEVELEEVDKDKSLLPIPSKRRVLMLRSRFETL